QVARQQVIDARRTAVAGRVGEAQRLLEAAIARSSDGPRQLIAAAEVALLLEEPDLARDLLIQALSLEPAKASLAFGRGSFAALGSAVALTEWKPAGLRQSLLAAHRAIDSSTTGTARLDLAARLLEIGCLPEAGDTLAGISGPTATTPGYFLLLATCAAQRDDLPAAVRACEQGLVINPEDPRLERRKARLQSAAAASP